MHPSIDDQTQRHEKQVDKSSGRNYSIQHITEAYHNDINRWDFLQVRFPGDFL